MQGAGPGEQKAGFLAAGPQAALTTREADGSTEGCCQSCGRRRASRATGRPTWRLAAPLTPTLRSNPIKHGNIRVIESSGQARNAATGLRYHNLRTRDNRGNARDSGAITARDRPEFSYSINTGHGFSLRQNAMSGGCAGALVCNPPYVMFFGVELSAFWHNCTLVYSAAPGLLSNRRAQARGVVFGRKPKLTAHQRAEAIARRARGEALSGNNTTGKARRQRSQGE
jgi:hypothetical protein